MDTKTAGVNPPPDNAFYIKPYFVKLAQPWMTNTAENQLVTNGTTYVNGLDFYNNSDIVIRFGRLDNVEFKKEKGRVKPYCGDIRIPVTYLKTRGQGNSQGGADMMQEWYFNTIRDMWFTNNSLLVALSQRYMEVAMNRAPNNPCAIGGGFAILPPNAGAPPACEKELPTAAARQQLINDYNGQLKGRVTVAWQTYNTNNTDIRMTQQVRERGWAGAGIWYNTIADINGAFITSVNSMPYFQSYPLIMEIIREERRKNDKDPSPKNQFVPNLSKGQSSKPEAGDNAIAIAQKLSDFYNWWNEDDPNSQKADKTVTGSAVNDIIAAIFGTTGLFSMRGENAHIHPLAQLAATGKALVDSAIINIGGSTIASGLGGLIRIFDPVGAGTIAAFISNMGMTIAFIGLTAGFILYYVLPFLPFLYFFFAFSTWIKSIFEAMVGVPLWALAHLRLDGEGLPGDSASSGYFLIFEIFIRPILTVFGLVAAVLILTAQVRMLNVLWTLVVDNLTGFEGYSSAGANIGKQVVYNGVATKTLPRNTVDQFFFTVVYAIIVYMMATASFKMIDKIPDQLLRFMGAGVSAFSDINPDPTEGLTRYAALGGITVGQQATQGLKQFSQEVGDNFAGELQKMVEALKK
jgi:conjugal transfer/type IV secretion protein DotA/TraY